MDTSTIEEHDVEEFRVRNENYEDFSTLTIWGDITVTDIIEVGNNIYTPVTPLLRRIYPTCWGLHRRTIPTEGFVRLDPVLIDGPSLTYQLRPTHSDEIGFLTKNLHPCISALESTFDIEIPNPIKDNISTTL